ncbi:hypothetical protein [Amycolatopsis eburnea]|uniref:Uncharacterized protein n=1 Tax=Amycolatopsis eburnea TaxID=2267691 RepID=A0A3R9E0A8_9PSEU|nr:hypothetical protein [Amycolatopsis eburnea]RSD21992.1 hypothetical protein EIY87_09245 [Amycolatopsis eburnea]
MAFYVRKREAEQWTGDNFDKVLGVLSRRVVGLNAGQPVEANGVITVPSTMGDFTLNVGDWIVTDDLFGEFLSDEEFHKQYDPAPAPA